MPANAPKKSATLSISLTQELHRAVMVRVEEGLYTSASELIREALRGLLRSEAREPRASLTDERFRDSLSERGREMGSVRERAGSLGEAARQRLNELELSQQLDTDLRLAPERLEKLKLRERS